MVSTFNMGNAQCDEIDKLVPNMGEGLDILALGFQESTWSGVTETKYSQPGPEVRLEAVVKARSAKSHQCHSSHSMEP